MGSLRDTVFQRVDLRPRKSCIVPSACAEVVGYAFPKVDHDAKHGPVDHRTNDVSLVRHSLRRRAYGFFPATVIPITSLGRAGVYFGNTRAFVACSKS
jgi:hypothetical protein